MFFASSRCYQEIVAVVGHRLLGVDFSSKRYGKRFVRHLIAAISANFVSATRERRGTNVMQPAKRY